MIINDEITAILLVVLFLATPIVFAASLYFQDKNRSTKLSSHPSKMR